jgi:predicted GIY-YIG superfamily endonuclease
VKYVYLLRSLTDQSRKYVGISADLNQRLAEHNAGKSPHTSKYVPWECVLAIRFVDEAKAEAFEAYLKQGSGHAFANRHFW